jgi:hypothetical protein
MRSRADLALCKVARWDPTKGWDSAVQTVHRLKDVKDFAEEGLRIRKAPKATARNFTWQASVN